MTTFEKVTVPVEILYDYMVEAHYEACLFRIELHNRFLAWLDSGAPSNKLPHSGMLVSDVESYLIDLRTRIEFIGSSLRGETVELTYKEFQRYATPNFSLKE